MAANATAVWRVRPAAFTGTANTNGAAFDCSISAAATGTHGSLAGSTFTDATAAAFVAGMVGSSINISGVGQYKILGLIDASNIRLGATGANGVGNGTTTFVDATANLFTAAMVGQFIFITGGGLTPGFYAVTGFTSASTITIASSPGTGTGATWTIGVSATAGWTSSQLPAMSGGMNWTVGSGQDYSQQNAPQVSQSNPANTSTSTVTLTDTGAAFTAALIGNGIWVSGTGITTTFTFITAVPSGTTLTLQTSPGAAGTAVSYNIGGAWLDFWTNTASGATFIVPGNFCYIMGSRTPTSASYTFDYTMTVTSFTPPVGTNSAGQITWANDPVTPGYKRHPDTTGGMPCISAAANLVKPAAYNKLQGLWFVSSSTNAGAATVTFPAAFTTAIGIIIDQGGFGSYGIFTSGAATVIGCEIFDSVGTATNHGVIPNSPALFLNCNIHDCGQAGMVATSGSSVVTCINCIVAKNKLDGLQMLSAQHYFIGNTIDGNARHGIIFLAQSTMAVSSFINNIISNHTAVGAAGIKVNAGTQAQNDLVRTYTNYNVFYNNTLDVTPLSYAANDTHGGSNPFVNQTTQNYNLA